MKKYIYLATLVLIIDRTLKAASMGIFGIVFPQHAGSLHIAIVHNVHPEWLLPPLEIAVAASIIYFGIMLAVSYFLKPATKVHTLPFALALFGTLSNLSDRLMYSYVINPIGLTYPGGWTNLNIADVIIPVGFVLYVAVSFANADWRILLPLKESSREAKGFGH